MVPEDFAVGGSFLASFSTAGLTEINISGNNLNTLLQQSIDSGQDYFQLKLGLSIASDNDGEYDGFQIDINNTSLTVEQ